MQTDWLKASTDERVILYRICKRLTAQLGIHLEEFAAAALRTRYLGPGFEENFRTGRIARKSESAIYQWLLKQHPDSALEVDQDIASLYGSAHADGWEVFLKQYGRFENFKIEPYHGQIQQRQLDTSIYGAPDAVAMSEARVFVPAQGSYIR